jgi:SAM-dependent methyltransferase
LSAEINDLLDRFAAGPQETALPPSAPDANREPRIRFDRHYLPTTLWSGASISANVRVTNIGAYAWSSHAADGLTLSTWWLRNGSPTVSGYTTATRFPIDVLPGRSISIPLRIETPSKSGAYVLRVGLARQDGGGAVSDFLDVPLHIAKPRYGLLNRFLSRSTRTLAREGSVEVHPGISDYGKDHAAGVGIVETTLKQRAKPGARMLEIGSGTHPHLAWLTDYQVAAVDISSPLLELGSLYFRGRFISRLAFLCADALNPPFRAGSFDVVAMFSALHHFAEPEILLERLAALLKPSGFIAVMCEPVGDTLEKPDTIRDLLKGINEQVFSVDEYLGIFQRAGLHGDHIRTDGGSLKAILSRQRPA